MNGPQRVAAKYLKEAVVANPTYQIVRDGRDRFSINLSAVLIRQPKIEVKGFERGNAEFQAKVHKTIKNLASKNLVFRNRMGTAYISSSGGDIKVHQETDSTPWSEHLMEHSITSRVSILEGYLEENGWY